VVMDEETGEPWFVAKDVAEKLGYVGTAKAIRTHCKYAKLFKGDKSSTLTDSPFGIVIIPEADLYRLIIKSKLPAAEQFEAWVMEEVLPAIRKHGGYLTLKLTYDALTDPDVIFNLAQALRADREKLAASRLEVSTLKDNLT